MGRECQQTKQRRHDCVTGRGPGPRESDSLTRGVLNYRANRAMLWDGGYGQTVPSRRTTKPRAQREMVERKEMVQPLSDLPTCHLFGCARSGARITRPRAPR